jgi:hypothetical protein
LYGLGRSPLLWQKELTKTFRKMGFGQVPQDPCVMIKGGVIVFFFVNDIVFCCRKKDQGVVDAARAILEGKYRLIFLGEPKWFLGIHVYVTVMAIPASLHWFKIDTAGRLPDAPMSSDIKRPQGQSRRSSRERQALSFLQR